ncbi:MAG: hemolysin family protein [Ilumatobacteraceae bacterium]|nr:hemolysin family protein [Ilumatobacteraceae bacterium]
MTPTIVRPRDVPLGTVARPLWRGRLHVFALFGVVPALAVLTVVARSERARISVVIYALGLCSMFVASATYHRWVHTLRARVIWRRIDHAMIFAAIAGSVTPICLLGVPNGLGVTLLCVMWVGCLFGIGMKIAGWKHQRIVGGVMYIAVSWVGVIAIPSLWREAGVLPAALMIVSGVFYTVGAIGLNRKWPRLSPAVFGYHEVWHLCTVIAAAAHLGAVWIIAT